MLIAAIVTAAGFSTITIRVALLATPVLTKKLSPRMITGLVTDIRHYATGTLRITLENPQISGGPALDKIRLTVRKFNILPRPGDRIRIRAGLLPPPPPTMPGDFDYARQLWFHGIGAIGYSVTSPQIIAPARGLRGLSIRQRLAVAANIRTVLPTAAGGLAVALVTGLRDGISPPDAKNMRNAGLAHLLAISGLHMGLLSGAAFFFVRFLLSLSEYLTLRYPIRKWAAAVAIATGAVYLYLSGGSLPTIRAFIMVSIVFLGVMTDRKAISLRLVAIAAMVILLLTPEAILSISFQMSFAAVVALVVAYERMAPRWALFLDGHQGWMKKLLFYLATLLFTTLVAELAIAPFALFYFNKLVQYGLVANLVAMPVMAIWVMPLIVAYLILGPLGLGFLALVPLSYGLDVIMFVAKTVAHAPGAYSLVPAMGTGALVMMILGALWFGLWRLPWRNFGIPVVIIGIIAAFFSPRPDILIDNSGRLIGVRTAANGLALSSLRAGRMSGRRWAQRFGQAKAKKWRGDGSGSNPWISCDRLGCLYRPKDGDNAGGMLVALIKNERALRQDCRQAQLVISLVPVDGKCPSARLVIDKWDFYHNGGYAIWLPQRRGGRIRVETVAASRGDRPWSRRKWSRKK